MGIARLWGINGTCRRASKVEERAGCIINGTRRWKDIRSLWVNHEAESE